MPDYQQYVTIANNNNFVNAIKNDIIRYKRKGITGILMALLIFFGHFYGFGLIMKKLWPYFLNLGEIKTIYIIATVLQHNSLILIY